MCSYYILTGLPLPATSPFPATSVRHWPAPSLDFTLDGLFIIEKKKKKKKKKYGNLFPYMGLKTMVESSRPRRRSFRKWPSYMTDRWGSHVLTRSPSSVPPTPTEWLATFPIYGLRIRQLERWDNQVLTSSPFSLPSTGGASLDSWSFALPDEPCKSQESLWNHAWRAVCVSIYGLRVRQTD